MPELQRSFRCIRHEWRPSFHSNRPNILERKAIAFALVFPISRPPIHYRCSQPAPPAIRSEEHTSELQSLMRISYAVFCLKKKRKKTKTKARNTTPTYRPLKHNTQDMK